MARASFGGAQDLSVAFASFYREYQDRLDTLARRAENRALEEQAAADSDAIDRWQSGEMSDARFLAYAERRAGESQGDEPEMESYWKKVLRDARKSILTEEINDGAEDLLDRIEEGKASWNDLLRYYQRYQRDLKRNDPLYKDIADQIEQVQDRVRDNQIEGAFARIQYQFEAGRISGSAAAAQIRALAQRYKQNDPARYYQLMQQALELQRYGGVYGSGGGGGGGGGGSSSSGGGSAGLDDQIDQLKVREDQLLALSYQANEGERVGEVTVIDRQGRVRTEEVLLANPDGTPSAQMEQLDAAMLDTYDRLIAGLIRDGSTEAGTKIKAKSDYILNHIQPRNTIAPERQANAMLQSGIALAERAADSDDPVAAWRQVQAWASDVQRWQRNLNARGQVVQHDTKGRPSRITTQYAGESLQNRTTQEFATQSASLAAFANAVASGDVQAMEKAIEALSGESEGIQFPTVTNESSTVMRLRAAMDLVTGIPEGRYARVIVPGAGMVYAPVQQTFATVVGDDGRPRTEMTSIPVDPRTGAPLADGNKGQQLVDVMVEIDGRVQMVKAVTEPSYFVGNQRVSASEYRSALQAYNDADERERTELPAPTTYQQVLVPGRNGARSTVWFFDEGRGLWFRNRVSKYGGVPLIFDGHNAELAQDAANRLGVDQKGTSYWNAPVEERRLEQRANRDWYDMATGLSRQEAQEIRRREFGEAMRENAASRMAAGEALGGVSNILDQFGPAGSMLSNSLRAIGQNLGIKTYEDEAPKVGGRLRTNEIDSATRVRPLPDVDPRPRRSTRIDLPARMRQPLESFDLPDLTNDREQRRRRRRRRQQSVSTPMYTDNSRLDPF